MISVKSLDGVRTKPVQKSDYVSAKTKWLLEFGYANLKEQDVSDALEAALNGTTNKSDVIHALVLRDSPQEEIK